MSRVSTMTLSGSRPALQPTITGDPALDAARDAYRRWDMASIARKRRLNWSRGIIFALLAAAATAGVLASQLHEASVAGIAGACSAAAALLGREAVGPSVERLWLVARAGAETIKSEAFKYAAGADPYTGADKADRLIASLSAIQADNISGVGSRGDHKGNPSFPRFALGQAEYLETRLQDQLAWYEGKARFYDRQVALWRLISLTLGLIGAVLSGIAASDEARLHLSSWIGVVGTLGGIAAAHVANSRFSYLAQTYELTARRLLYLQTQWNLCPEDQRAAKWDRFVLECESTISAEREQWVKEWQRKIAESAPAAAVSNPGGRSRYDEGDGRG